MAMFNSYVSLPEGIYDVMWLKQCHLHHPPVITIFIGMVTIPKWVVYYCFAHHRMYGYMIIGTYNVTV